MKHEHSHDHEHDHKHEHNHNHHSCGHHNIVSGNLTIKLFFTILLNLMISISEIIGGLLSGSLALLSDAFHNFSDVFSLIISYIAILFTKKQKNQNKTFGYKRAEILAALFNIIILFIACFYIIFEAIKRFFTPYKINISLMLIITVIGLIGNGLSIIILHADSKKNLNIKSSFLHLLGDTISSVGVLIIAIVLYFNPKLYFLDPIISILIVLYILKESFSIFFETINILMQSTPKGLNINNIIKRLKEDKEIDIVDIYHVHVWSLSMNEIIFDCHVIVKENDLSLINCKLKLINEILECEYNITHTTIQFEQVNSDHSHVCRI